MTADDEWVRLWRGCVAGDPAVAEVLCRKAYPFIVGVFRRLTHDPDLTSDRAQDFFLWLFEEEQHRLKSFRPELGTPLLAYFRILAVRFHITQWRKPIEQNRGTETTLEHVTDTLASPPEAERLMVTQELYEMIAKLPLRENEATLWRLKGLRDEEIAKLMGITAGGVGALLWRARERLRRLLDGE